MHDYKNVNLERTVTQTERNALQSVAILLKENYSLRTALVNLREAQKAYMADRGNNELGKMVAQRADEADLVLVWFKPTHTSEEIKG